MDWTSQAATIVIEGTVTGETPVVPLDRYPVHRTYGRHLFVRVDQVLWKSIDQVPAAMEIGGPMSEGKDDGRIVDLDFAGAYRLKKGDQFVGAIVLDPGLGVDGFLQTPTSVIKVTDGKLSPIDQAPEYQQELAGKSVDDLKKLLQG